MIPNPLEDLSLYDVLTPQGFTHAIRRGEIDFLDALALAPEVLRAAESRQGWNTKMCNERQTSERSYAAYLEGRRKCVIDSVEGGGNG